MHQIYFKFYSDCVKCSAALAPSNCKRTRTKEDFPRPKRTTYVVSQAVRYHKSYLTANAR